MNGSLACTFSIYVFSTHTSVPGPSILAWYMPIGGTVPWLGKRTGKMISWDLDEGLGQFGSEILGSKGFGTWVFSREKECGFQMGTSLDSMDFTNNWWRYGQRKSRVLSKYLLVSHNVPVLLWSHETQMNKWKCLPLQSLYSEEINQKGNKRERNSGL